MKHGYVKPENLAWAFHSHNAFQGSMEKVIH